MGFCQSVNKEQLFNLLTGMLGIYILYFIAGILHESIVKRPHFNRITKNYEICQNAVGILILPFTIGWILGWLYNIFMLPVRVYIPQKKSAITGGVVVAATYFSTLAIQRTSFPVVIMFQSCSILPVIFIAVFCSRVHDPNLKLGPKKIIVALIITAGILTFQIADPETKQRQTKQSLIGILFLILHFIAQGFLPDLQAQIKVDYKPQPTQMMSQINKWCAIITVVLAIVTMNAWSFVIFLWEHLQFTADLIIMSIVSGFGQFFVYRMIKQFKQHFVPFTISSRKILTATISIVFYDHQTNWIQILGICVVLFTVFVQFMTEITKQDKQQSTSNKDIVHQLHEQKFQQEFKPNQQGCQQTSQQGNQQASSSKSSQLKTNELEYMTNNIEKEQKSYNKKNSIEHNQQISLKQQIQDNDNVNFNVKDKDKGIEYKIVQVAPEFQYKDEANIEEKEPQYEVDYEKLKELKQKLQE